MSRVNKNAVSKASAILKSGQTVKSAKSYKVMPKEYSPELQDLILTGCKMRKTFNIKPEHVDKALRDVRKSK